MFRYLGSFFNLALTHPQAIKPEDQVIDILKVKFDVTNAAHLAYIDSKLKAFNEKQRQLTTADQIIAAVAGASLLLCVSGYNGFLSLAGFSVLTYLATAKTERSDKSQSFFRSLDELYALSTWCQSGSAGLTVPPQQMTDLHNAIMPYNLDVLEGSAYQHFKDTVKSAASTTQSAFTLMAYGKRFATPSQESYVPKLN